MAADFPDHGAAITRMVTEGIGIPDLAQMMGMGQQDVKAGLQFVKPLRGVQIRTAVYPLWEALAAFRSLEEAGITDELLEQQIMRMKSTQLPVGLQAEFWSAQKKKVEYQEAVGQLWRTPQVQHAIADLLKIVRTSMGLMVDNIDQQTALTPRQRELIKGVGDSVMAELRDKVMEHFAGWDGAEDKLESNPAKRDAKEQTLQELEDDT